MALQGHGPPEGAYVHQVAHVLFTFALCYLYWHTRKTQKKSAKGWIYFRIFCLLLVAWNIFALIGHEICNTIQSYDFLDKSILAIQQSPPLPCPKKLYYLSLMEHFFILPALAALVLSLRTFYLDSSKKENR